MGCTSCKKRTMVEGNAGEDNMNIISKILVFIIGVMVISFVTPFLVLIGFYMLFKSIFLNKSTEIMPSLRFVIELLKRKKGDEGFEDDEEFNEDDYELMGVEVINDKDE